MQLVLQQGRTGAAAHRGRAGGLAVAELELEATNAYALIMSLGSLPMRPSNCKLKRELEAGLNSAGLPRLDPTPLVVAAATSAPTAMPRRA